MTEIGADDALRRFELDGVIACLGTALLALVITTVTCGVMPALNVAAGVLGGGLLMALSYRSIKGVARLVAEVAARAGDAAATPSTSPPSESPQPREAPRSAAAGRVRDEAGQEDEAAAETAGEDTAGDGPTVAALSTGRRTFIAVKFLIRYALLAIAAYVMLMRFHLHPVGLLAGTLAPFLAAVMQVGRLSRARARRPTP